MSKLSAQEQAFIDHLFDGQVMRHPDEAKQMAGYPKDYPVLKIVKAVRQELIDKYDDFLALYAPKGMVGLMQVLESPETPGSAIKLKAVVELLNRAGVTTKEKKEAQAEVQSFVYFLPNKTPTGD
jgi:hypothetical protein